MHVCPPVRRLQTKSGSTCRKWVCFIWASLSMYFHMVLWCCRIWVRALLQPKALCCSAPLTEWLVSLFSVCSTFRRTADPECCHIIAAALAAIFRVAPWHYEITSACLMLTWTRDGKCSGNDLAVLVYLWGLINMWGWRRNSVKCKYRARRRIGQDEEIKCY